MTEPAGPPADPEAGRRALSGAGPEAGAPDGSEGRPAGGPTQTAVDLGTGLAIALPVYWLFTKLLAINLPGLTGTGWI